MKYELRNYEGQSTIFLSDGHFNLGIDIKFEDFNVTEFEEFILAIINVPDDIGENDVAEYRLLESYRSDKFSFELERDGTVYLQNGIFHLALRNCYEMRRLFREILHNNCNDNLAADGYKSPYPKPKDITVYF